MKYYVIAGEASGDLHGSNLLKAIQQQQPEADFRCWGGDLMTEAKGNVVKHYRDLAFMGFLEVLLNIWTIFKNIRFCKQDILNYKPDALVLIDYPGFNLRIAKWAKAQNIKVIYYISPQIWAWDEKRVHQIKKNVDLMLCILPFEQGFYKKYDYAVNFVGHPLLDVIKNDKQIDDRQIDDKQIDDKQIDDRAENDSLADNKQENYKREDDSLEDERRVGNMLSQNVAQNAAQNAAQNVAQKPIIALLPGSRKQEVLNMLNTMLSIAPQFTDYQFIIAGAPALDAAFYQETIEKKVGNLGINVSFVKNETYNLLRKADAALVTSGTATLEVALFGIPQIVCYRTSAISYWLAKRLIRIKYISLVNLIADKPLVLELIQSDLTTENLATELKQILLPANRRNLEAGYADLRQLLGNEGASQRAANAIIQFLI
ncbi:MAG: hypothetical protein RI894_180 [Bacteroidota bacterium]